MLRVFLDANVLFSAAWRSSSKLSRLWELPDVKLVTSGYAVSEALRNLGRREAETRLVALVDKIEVLESIPDTELPSGIDLHPKDEPILKAAIAGRCQVLLTGDKKHFGHMYESRIGNVKIQTPGAFVDALGKE
jgi:uncharacterized protein